MRVWALSDLHLSLGGDKPMDVFGDHWASHHLRMAEAWDRLVAPQDLVLSPGDFSWAMKPGEATADFRWLGQRPGRKVLIKGNHDYWWPSSKTKLASLLPADTWALKKQACIIDGIGIFGVRGGDFAPLTRYGDKRSQEDVDQALEREERELQASIEHLQRLEDQHGPSRLRICLFHYPPVPPGSRHSRFTPMIEAMRPLYCIYGHLHGGDAAPARIEGDHHGITYRCTSCDLIDFSPVLIHDDS
jgi:predicted phosphohydrolase